MDLVLPVDLPILSEVSAYRNPCLFFSHSFPIFTASSIPSIVRPKVHYARPSHPPPDPPILEGAIGGSDARLPPFGSHICCQTEAELLKQRHSFPERLVRSRSSDVVLASRRPMSDPGWNIPGSRRAVNEEIFASGAVTGIGGPTSSPSKDSLVRSSLIVQASHFLPNKKTLNWRCYQLTNLMSTR